MNLVTFMQSTPRC